MKLKISGALELEVLEEAPRFLFSITQNKVTFKDINMLILPTDQKVLCRVEPVDAKGNPAKIEGSPSWTSSNEAIVTIAAQPDDGTGTYSAWVTPATQLGACQINVTGDADLGAGVTTIVGTLDLEVVGGQAVGFAITHDAPVPQKG